MAKMIIYNFLSCEVNRGTSDRPITEQVLLEKQLQWTEANEEIAKQEAIDGRYRIETNPDPIEESQP